MRLAREYRGVIIWPAGENSSGIRWTANVNGNLRADTLAGIKALIRHRLRTIYPVKGETT